MASLRTNYKDDILSGDRKYRMITNSDGTVSFQDVTDYTQEGDTFGALDINATNTAVNALQEANGDTDISGIGDGTNTGAIHTLNTTLNGVLGWTTLQSVTGMTPVQLPNDYHDVMVRASVYTGGAHLCVNFALNKNDFDTSRRFLSGCSDGSTANGYFAVQTSSNNTVSLARFLYNSDYTASAEVSVSYR